jgi:hypothetical protein
MSQSSTIEEAKGIVSKILTTDANDTNGYAKNIQDILNNVLSNNGVITPNQQNALDEQVRLAKLKILKDDVKKTYLKIGLISGGLILGFGFLWYVTRDKFKK